MSELAARLLKRIARQGPITLAEYLAEALTHPRQGYYMTGDPFGARGDFVTAPEISQMFGELIGLWCAETWQRLGAPEALTLVELGPGRGTLLADLLRAAKVVPGFREALDLHIVEVSPTLRELQARSLAGVATAWHESLAEVPQGRPLLVIANEFFDALPIRQFERTPEGWRERLVGLAPEGDALAFGLSPPAPYAEALLPDALRDATPGAVAEVSPAALSLTAEIGRRLAEDGGAALIVDYGHAAPDGRPTLQALRRHAREDVLASPGQADLTAHVDFGALARAARAAGAEAWGPTPQGAFLEALGIATRAERLAAGASPEQAAEIRTALHRLTAPEEMGTLFKVLVLSAPGLGPLAGCAA
ncbi:MAG: SAM-dependent methyltransferase [Kiloniellales bacterium]|nr:SAM-dependent methyltransferase [Kiloniellales bacterium]